MDRPRSSKRGYHYDQDSPPPRSKPRFDRRGGLNPNTSYNRRGSPRGGDRRGGFLTPDSAPPPPPPPLPSLSSSAAMGGGGLGEPGLTTSIRILCPQSKVYGFPPSFIAKVRDHSSALVTVLPPYPGDAVRVMETADG